MSTIKDIARKSGFSTSTVSMVLRKKPHFAQSTRKRILELAEKMNYRPNATSLALVSGKTKNVGLIVTDISSHLVSRIILSIERNLSRKGFHVILCNTQGNPSTESRYVRVLQNGKVDGIILASVQEKAVKFRPLIDSGLSLVLLDRYKNARIDSVSFDVTKAAHLAVSHLIRLGHREIAYVGGPAGLPTDVNKQEGFRNALRDAGLSVKGMPLVSAGFTAFDGHDAVRTLLREHPGISALFCFNDRVALGGVYAARETGRNVPDDVAFVGCDNTEEAVFSPVPLTTVELDGWQLGALASDMIVGRINRKSGKTHLFRQVSLEPKLVIRESCGYVSVEHPTGKVQGFQKP